MKCTPVLFMDYYKACHDLMLPEGITKSVSYFIPRGSRVKGWDKAVFFGLQGFIKEYLIEDFDKNFFQRQENEVIEEYDEVLKNTMPENSFSDRKIRDLYKLGYLPIEIKALPEGISVPIGTPMFCITNTHPGFAWLPQMLESLISCEMWHSIISATVAKEYYKLAYKYYSDTVEWNEGDAENAIACFDMRGEDSLSSAVKAGAAWATVFSGCATVPTAVYLKEYYNLPLKSTIKGSPSTEHAVMCSNYAVDGEDETVFIKRMLKEVYPTTSFSIVLDSYDYERAVTTLLPELKDDILDHVGTVLIRGDSGDPVKTIVWTVEKLWEIFGGIINTKGYKVLNNHVRAIYGDSITLKRCKEIYESLKEKKFAAENVRLGAGSFSFQAIENEDGTLSPFTRDTFNIAIKATYIETGDNVYKIYKSPKVKDENGEKKECFKKSPKGCILVNNNLEPKDNLVWYQQDNQRNMLKTVFKDGRMINESYFNTLRTYAKNAARDEVDG